MPYDISLSMLAYLLLSKVDILHKAVHIQPYLHVYISVSQLVRNIGIAVLADIAMLAGNSSIR